MCVAVSVAFGQKKAVTEALKLAKDAKPNFEEARTKIKAALENAETMNDAKTWYTAGQIESIVIDGQIAQQILGKQPDEVTMYGALEKIYPYFEKAYVLDNQPDAKGKVKPKHTKDMQAILKADLPYYFNGAIYFWEKQDYKKALDFFNDYIKVADSDLMKDGVKPDAAAPVDSSYILSKYYAAIAAMQTKDHATAISTLLRASKQDYNQNDIYQYLAEEYKAIADTAEWEKTLGEGLAIFPKEPYYLLSLIQIYINTGRNDRAIDYINTAIQNDPANANLYEVAGVIYESGFQDIAKAEEYFKKAIEIDGQNAQTQSNLGRIYFNQAVNQLNLANDIQDVRKYNEEKTKANDLFKKAMPYFEKSLQLDSNAPETTEASEQEARDARIKETRVALRSIYYNLNMGDKLAEIEKQMGIE
jgi:tetratricopeptide (TPR) repeat protein